GNAVPQHVAVGRLDQQRPLADGELGLGADADDAGLVLAEGIEAGGGEALQRGPGLPGERDELALLLADRAIRRRSGARRVLRAAGGADVGWHGPPPLAADRSHHRRILQSVRTTVMPEFREAKCPVSRTTRLGALVPGTGARADALGSGMTAAATCAPGRGAARRQARSRPAAARRSAAAARKRCACPAGDPAAAGPSRGRWHPISWSARCACGPRPRP